MLVPSGDYWVQARFYWPKHIDSNTGKELGITSDGYRWHGQRWTSWYKISCDGGGDD